MLNHVLRRLVWVAYPACQLRKCHEPGVLRQLPRQLLHGSLHVCLCLPLLHSNIITSQSMMMNTAYIYLAPDGALQFVETLVRSC